jgi:hypothetical protein
MKMAVPRNMLRMQKADLEKRIMELEGELASAIVRADKAEVLAEERLMSYGRQMAKVGVFMQAMAWLARNEPHLHERAQAWVKSADQASLNVRLEDFVVARTA